MRNTVAKRIRNEARKISRPTERQVKWYHKIIRTKPGELTVEHGTVSCTGYRRTYQDMKKAYMQR